MGSPAPPRSPRVLVGLDRGSRRDCRGNSLQRQRVDERLAGLGSLQPGASTAYSSPPPSSSSRSPVTPGSQPLERKYARRNGRFHGRSHRARTRCRPLSDRRSSRAGRRRPERLAATSTPLRAAVDAVGATWAQPVVRAGAAVASLGALLALIAGVGRTTLAMARNGDLPRWLASIEERRSVPDHAEIALGAVVIALVLATDLRGAIGFSSFGVLVYYAVANASAFTQSPAHRRWSRGLNIVGGVACIVLVASLPRSSIISGLAVVGIGLAGRAVVNRTRRRT